MKVYTLNLKVVTSKTLYSHYISDNNLQRVLLYITRDRAQRPLRVALITSINENIAAVGQTVQIFIFEIFFICPAYFTHPTIALSHRLSTLHFISFFCAVSIMMKFRHVVRVV